MKRSIAAMLIVSALNIPAVRAVEDPSAASVSAFIERLQKCWVAPAAARKTNLLVRIQFRLKADGTLLSLPKVLNSSDHPLFASVKGSVVKAVVDCQPYNLPGDKYDLWRDNTIDFRIPPNP